MKKIIIFSLIFIFPNIVFSYYKLEKGSEDLVLKYNISTKNLEKEITRKEFVEILYEWYKDYKKNKGINIDYSNYKKLDNSKVFIDVDLESDFGKKLSYFTNIGAFAKNEYFNPNATINQKSFFKVMSRLKILFSLNGCKSLKICEKEADETTPFIKGTYLKYVSKILDKNLRKYYTNPKDYINAGYKSFLDSSYYFPNLKQTLNGCYAYSVRNILKYKHSIGVYVSKAEEIINKDPNQLWTYTTIDDFNKLVHIDANKYYNIDTLINSLQVGEPISISYLLKYYSRKNKEYKYVPHIVAAYSFDESGVWISETVANRRILISWDEIFLENGQVKLNRIFKYNYQTKDTWSQDELDFEEKNNILVGE